MNMDTEWFENLLCGLSFLWRGDTYTKLQVHTTHEGKRVNAVRHEDGMYVRFNGEGTVVRLIPNLVEFGKLPVGSRFHYRGRYWTKIPPLRIWQCSNVYNVSTEDGKLTTLEPYREVTPLK